MVANRFSLLQ